MKSQASMEFIGVVLVVMLFLVVFYVVAYGKEASTKEEERQRSIDTICSNIVDRINNAVYFGTGFSQNLTLPENLYGRNYSMQVYSNRTLICRSGDYSSIKTFIEVKNITNTTHGPPFFIPQREIKIEHSNGNIVIS